MAKSEKDQAKKTKPKAKAKASTASESGAAASDLVAPELKGLTSAEVAERVAQGKANSDGGPKTKTIPEIVAAHTFTLFNGVNAVLAGLVIVTGSYRNLVFLLVVIANLLIGIVQEVRSKRTIDKLSILAERPVKVRRDGADAEITHSEVVQDDLIILGRGDQIPADAEVVWGTAGVNESLLTGESKPINKGKGDKLMSGSFLDSGSLVAKVTCVGAESYAARINAEAKYVKAANSEILATLNMIIRYATWLLAPIGIALFLRELQDGYSLNESILTVVAALVGMIPQGLMLLTSTVLALSTMRLASKKVLIQQFYCIEMLARVDTLCLDKTGTITSGQMDYEKAYAIGKHTEDEVVAAAATVVAADRHDANETARAILEYVDKQKIAVEESERTVAFSSARKYSGCVTKGGKAYVMGAAQFIFADGVPDEVTSALENTSLLERTLVVATCEGFNADDTIKGEAEPLGVVTISDHIRSNAPATMKYFVEQGVTLNVISGDDPHTVSSIAEQAGVPDADKWVDASTLTTPELIEQATKKYHVFGRVTPQQKRALLRALQKQGHTVAMTGDGVNDVLALREADCSVAMASGSDAARNVAEVVLVDNDFAHMPDVVAEGRRSINNLQRSASLFLVKTVFSAVLALLCAIIPPYPFEPIQMTLISFSVIGVPSFVLALEPNHDRIKGNFLANVLCRSLPGSVAVILAVGLASGVLEHFGLSRDQISTLCVMLTCTIGFMLIVRISLPLNTLRTALLVVILAIITLGFTVARNVFLFTPIAPEMWIAYAVIGGIATVVFHLLYNWGRSLATNDRFTGYLTRLEKRNIKQK